MGCAQKNRNHRSSTAASLSAVLFRLSLGMMAPAIGAVLPLLLPIVAIAQTPPLDREVASIIAQNKMGQAEVGVSIIDVDSGDVIAGVNERKRLAPASNLKVLTAGTAALVLGKDWQFTTEIHVQGDRVIIIGSGDPALGDPELLKEQGISADEFLKRLVEPLAAAGVTGIREVVVDDRAFDRDMIHPTWPKNQLSRWYCAPVSGVNFHTNIVEVWPRPAGVGEPATFRKSPDAPWIEIVNRTRTVSGRGTTAIGLDRDGTGSSFVLSGTILSAPQEPISATVSEPAIVFGRLIGERIAASASMAARDATGAPVPINVRLATAEERWDFKEPAVVIVQTPLAPILRRCNVDSYNLYAEALIKAIGHKVTGQPGSWANGAAVIRMQVAKLLGPDAGELVIVDGSGMSAENDVAPSLLARWLAAVARDKDIGSMFVESLPMPGEGTLARRFSKRPKGITIHAKSGFIRGVQCLSGYITSDESGRRLAFSVMVNKLELAQGSAKELHEDIVRKAAEWMERQPARRTKLGG
ncbi:MAG: D-alanyl-D-alanine carboxypeptidase/D-alanyl-D-alanine-endopeptidase [Phycisphaerales bacterium]|nr:D-alanyl-D-alanine carboxypeptidase/D-alanyl-D-alanine-endopeptidase [Phycisphaerales bacterium]